MIGAAPRADDAATRATVSLSLVSHTNAGKTTLARTLVGRDIGEVRDAPHVTKEASAHPLFATDDGDSLVLWDTPGFGDSARLARRLAQQGNPIGWFLSQVWDRYRDRAFWHSQQAVRNLRERADVVLYLVNASEAPADAGWLAPEMDVLAWIAKPVVVLLNQTGPPRPPAEEADDLDRWRAALERRPMVRDVLSLDAFARCWVQELVLARTLRPCVPEHKRAAFDRLARAWRERRIDTFEKAIEALAAPIARAAVDAEPVAESRMRGALRDLGRAIGVAPGADDPRATASGALRVRLETDLAAAADRVIAIHGLEGRAREVLSERLAGATTTIAPVSEGRAALVGGAVSGAVTGLAADLAAGGLTFGAGLVTGALLGALGGAGLARGVNLARGRDGAFIRWDARFLDGLCAAALLRYLAVAHFGRGRGDWAESESPAFWRERVEAAVTGRADALAALWGDRDARGDETATAAALREVLSGATIELLDTLYPGALDEPR
ncbi:MAG: DUF3482 domain-containing protein [Burkholderiales bacterium]